ncbi:hypothetical protein MAPG_10018 [Magnaporthiopsis poae ATCC 64411]|uniref:Uncharacterized protein n=1 Tax=Magnaporthiopsis poae (strain ATCC 64411 / 73-15) TaxID=644358 RepID=A0A0C4EBH1_MAGP6|nr:hypothetical protein MAPG_10018 [Magnaporthiopsis poae ATCC 64411]
MHLTMMELWTALDSSAVNLVPLLREYAPGFPLGVFDELVLPKREQLVRLARVEDYLARRRAAAGSNGPPWQLLSDRGSWSKTCFAVCHYNSSPRHQQLHKSIIRKAEEANAADKQRAAFAAGVARRAKQSHEEAAARVAEAAKAVDAAKATRAARAAEAVRAAVAARAAKATRRTEASATVAAAVAAAAAAAGVAEAAGVAMSAAEKALAGAQNAKSRAEKDMTDAEAEVDKMWRTSFVWPLPQDETAAKAVVFELRAPTVFAVWRETTLSILAGFCDTNPGESRLFLWYPSDHPAVARSLGRSDGGRPGRFRLAFEVDSSCRDRGMGDPYQYSQSRFGEPFCVKYVTDGCGLYDGRPGRVRLCYPPGNVPPTLRKWILGTAHTPNDVLAAQSQCPENMTLDEFRTIGCLRAGPQLQWQNMLLQLAMPSLDLNRPEAFFLGPRGEGPDVPRGAHAILGEEPFGVALLAALEDALCRVARKWESEVSLCIFVSLAVKLLSFSPHWSVRHRCLDYLLSDKFTSGKGTDCRPGPFIGCE